MGFDTFGFDSFAKELEKIGNVDSYAPELLKAASPILEKGLRSEVGVAVNKGYATGDLKKSIEANEPSENQRGHYVSVTAQGSDRKGIRNNEKLAYLNYGTSKQVANPVIAKAIQKTEKDCLEAMQNKFNEVIKF